jgi:hypothetical protein
VGRESQPKVLFSHSHPLVDYRRKLMMSRAAALVLFATVAVAMVAQTSVGGRSPEPTPQTQTSTVPGNNGSSRHVNPELSQSAQDSAQSPSPSPSADIGHVAAGTEVHAILDTPLSTRTSKPGDRFTATVLDTMNARDGAVAIPSGSRVEGEVAEADEGKALAALRGKGKLSLRFRDVVLPNGQTLPLTATLISVHDTSDKSIKKANEEGQAQSTAGSKDVGIGAGVGSIFGGPLKGLAVGTLEGGGYVLATKAKEVHLPARTGMVIRLDQPVSWNGQSPPMQR